MVYIVVVFVKMSNCFWMFVCMMFIGFGVINMVIVVVGVIINRLLVFFLLGDIFGW